MMPARRAVCSGSPFLTAPLRISFNAALLIVISPRASASRVVTALSPTSTMRTSPRGPTCDRAADCLPAGIFTLREIERQALERDRQVDALQLHILRHLQRARREIEDRLDAGGDHHLHHPLRVRRGNRDHRDVQPIAAGQPLQLLDVEDWNAAALLVADLLVGRVEQRDDLEPFLAEPRIVGERQPEIAGTHDHHAKPAIEPEDLAQVTSQIGDVIADAAYAELAEVREVLANLRGVEMELLGER